jgi:hypothetical protein
MGHGGCQKQSTTSGRVLPLQMAAGKELQLLLMLQQQPPRKTTVKIKY